MHLVSLFHLHLKNNNCIVIELENLNLIIPIYVYLPIITDVQIMHT